MKRTFATALSLPLFLALVAPVSAQPNVADPAVMFSYDQKLNVKLPMDLTFTNEAGTDVSFGSFFGKRPVIFAMVQYRCPKLCNQVLSGMTLCLAQMPGRAGEDYEVVVVSMDPREKAMPELYRDKKAAYIDEYMDLHQRHLVSVPGGKPLTDAAQDDLRASLQASWHFLAGDVGAIDTLAAAVGFRYSYNPQADRYAHPSGVVVLTPEGLNSRYFDGILFKPSDVKGALDTARRNGIGRPMTTMQRVLLLCYDFDSETGTMKANVMKIVRTAGVVTVVALAAFIFFGGRLRPRRLTAEADSGALFTPTPIPSHANGILTSGEIKS